jgi:hypothetical protein
MFNSQEPPRRTLADTSRPIEGDICSAVVLGLACKEVAKKSEDRKKTNRRANEKNMRE